MALHSPGDAGSRGAGKRVALGFANLHVSSGDHIGHFYQTREEWQPVFVQYLKAGLTAGDRCVYLAPAEEREPMRRLVTAAGVDVDGALRSRQLILDQGKTHPD